MEPITLTSDERRALRARAHPLHPVVMIAKNGLTPAVLAEIDRALSAHELIKVRVAGQERDVREAYLKEICATLGCAPVQHLGNLLILWRPKPETEKSAATTSPTPAKAARAPKSKTSFQDKTTKRRSAPAKR